MLGVEFRDQVVEGEVGLAVEEPEAAGEAVSNAVGATVARPAMLRGPVDFWAFSRLEAICASDVMFVYLAFWSGRNAP